MGFGLISTLNSATMEHWSLQNSWECNETWTKLLYFPTCYRYSMISLAIAALVTNSFNHLGQDALLFLLFISLIPIYKTKKTKDKRKRKRVEKSIALIQPTL